MCIMYSVELIVCLVELKSLEVSEFGNFWCWEMMKGFCVNEIFEDVI